MSGMYSVDVFNMMYYDLDSLLCNCPNIDSDVSELEDKVRHLEARVAELEKCIGRLIRINLKDMPLPNDVSRELGDGL